MTDLFILRRRKVTARRYAEGAAHLGGSLFKLVKMVGQMSHRSGAGGDLRREHALIRYRNRWRRGIVLAAMRNNEKIA